MELTKRAFAWYHPERKDWYAASGEYEILIGSSSREIRLSKTVCMENTSGAVQRIEANTVIGDIVANPQAEKSVFKVYGSAVEGFRKAQIRRNDAADHPEPASSRRAKLLLPAFGRVKYIIKCFECGG